MKTVRPMIPVQYPKDYVKIAEHTRWFNASYKDFMSNKYFVNDYDVRQVDRWYEEHYDVKLIYKVYPDNSRTVVDKVEFKSEEDAIFFMMMWNDHR